ncbi:hypothetical protein ACFYYS_06355 [Streptomyces sp. NPDC002120]
MTGTKDDVTRLAKTNPHTIYGENKNQSDGSWYMICTAQPAL